MEALGILANMAQYPGANLPAIEEYVGRVANDPSFASFFLSAANKQGLGQAGSSPNAQSSQGATNLVPEQLPAGGTA
jgi:hypothetical protein